MIRYECLHIYNITSMGTVSYIKNFLKDPRVASVTPTSRFTVEKVCKRIDFSNDIRILEYGPGDGVFTRVLLDKMTPKSKIIAIETNSGFVEELESMGSDRLIVKNTSVEQVDEIVKAEKWGEVDYIISGIPFSFLEETKRHDILDKSAHLLKDEGIFLAYQTSAHLKPFLKQHFKSVRTTMEYRNIPPMCIYVAK